MSGNQKGYKYKVSEDGVVLNKDGTVRGNAFAKDRHKVYQYHTEMCNGHRGQGCGEDQESILI